MVSVKNLICVTLMFAKGCGALPGAKINAGCGTPSKNQKFTGDTLSLAENSAQKPYWLGAVMTANYNKNGLFDTLPEQWKYTEPYHCSGLRADSGFKNANRKLAFLKPESIFVSLLSNFTKWDVAGTLRL